jgi:type IV pilus assembly protein PilM
VFQVLGKLLKKVRPKIGIDIGATSIKAVEIKGKLPNLQVISFHREKIPPDVIVDGEISNKEILIKKLENIVQKHAWQGKQVVTAVGGRKVVIRHIKFPIMPEIELKQAIQFEMEKYMPFGNQEIVVDYVNLGPVINDKIKQYLVLLATIPKEIALSYYDVFFAAGLDLVAIDIIPLALQRALFLKEGDEEIAVADVGADTTNFSIIRGTKVSFARTIALAGSLINQNISKASYAEIAVTAETQEDFSRVTNTIRSYQLMKESSMELVRELRRSFDFWQTQSQGNNISKLILTGGVANLTGFDTFLSQELEMRVQVGYPFSFLQKNDSLFGPEYALALGLALRGVTS